MDSIVDSHRSLCPDTTNLNKKMFIPCDQYAWIYSAIDIAEITLGLTSAVIVGFSLYVFVCCPIFSRNMTSIGYTIGANFYAILLFRFIAIFLYMANGKSTSSLTDFFSCTVDLHIFECGRIGFLASYFAALICLTADRLIATVQLATYEKQNKLYFVLFSITFQVLTFFLVFFARFYDWVSFECAVLATAFLNWIIFVSFMYVERINYRWYKDSQKLNMSVYTLSERFQLSENIRTSKVLKETMILCCTLNSVVHVAVFVVYVSTNPLVCQVAVTVFNFTIFFYAITFVANPMLTVAPYKRKIKQIFNSLRCLNTVGLNETHRPVLFDLTGNPMNFNVGEETNLYFESLKRQWR